VRASDANVDVYCWRRPEDRPLFLGPSRKKTGPQKRASSRRRTNRGDDAAAPSPVDTAQDLLRGQAATTTRDQTLARPPASQPCCSSGRSHAPSGGAVYRHRARTSKLRANSHRNKSQHLQPIATPKHRSRDRSHPPRGTSAAVQSFTSRPHTSLTLRLSGPPRPASSFHVACPPLSSRTRRTRSRYQTPDLRARRRNLAVFGG